MKIHFHAKKHTRWVLFSQKTLQKMPSAPSARRLPIKKSSDLGAFLDKPWHLGIQATF